MQLKVLRFNSTVTECETEPPSDVKSRKYAYYALRKQHIAALWSYISVVFSILFVHWMTVYPLVKRHHWTASSKMKHQMDKLNKWVRKVNSSSVQWLRGYKVHYRRNGSMKRKRSSKRKHLHKRTTENKHQEVLKKYQYRWLLYRQMPLKTMSRLWGTVNKINLPVFLRYPAYQIYIKLFNCCMDEVAVQDLKAYKNLSEFFRRNLKNNIRPIANCSVTSPADGRVLHLGKVQDSILEQVKGITYSLHEFLGPLNFMDNSNAAAAAAATATAPSADANDDSTVSSDANTDTVVADSSEVASESQTSTENNADCAQPTDPVCDTEPKTSDNGADATTSPADISPNSENKTSGDADSPSNDPQANDDSAADIKKLLHHAGSSLYYIVIYLGPGDYHHFHSPTEWIVNFRRHFSGYLFSVNPRIASWLQGLFSLNERVMYCGNWRHGFFSLTAVGATNVGSINIYFDEELETNSRNNKFREHKDRHFTTGEDGEPGGIKCHKGQMIGDFNFGSSIVLLFEGPENMEFCVAQGQRIKFGQALTTL